MILALRQLGKKALLDGEVKVSNHLLSVYNELHGGAGLIITQATGHDLPSRRF